ncbi:hypothetical protein EJ03DRAFT_159621 [Teratosphaeria nubilosa]|uniref:RING-type domain-containing protein n=1 Tax=Teratosphaeria nubilosa TaxID=161662 RepID=A0A6G1L2R7_9PEZI|nr:hypothetical protein EJ03DRAFT_159621 [Teratosphaeria nubilosa]
MSHSKRNTSLAFFTAHERAEAATQWGSKSTRLTRDSFLPFGSCQLCLRPAREPVACPGHGHGHGHGHLFCRECAVANLLAQTAELKRLRKEAERRQADDAEEQELADAEANAKAVQDFETLQAGLAAKGVKRKFDGVEDEVGRGMMGGKSKKVGPRGGPGGKSELAAFWVPSELPQHNEPELKAIRPQPVCPAAAADSPHEFSLKTLVTVHFVEDKTTKDNPDTLVRSCPSCTKALSNSTKAVLAKPCGHVLCKPCSDKFQKAPAKSAHVAEYDETVRCYVCQEDVTAGRKVKRAKEGGKEKEGKGMRGLVELTSDGTGFAGGGKNMVKKHGVAFQC